MKLKHLLDRDLLVKHVEEGFVSRQEHPTLPLAIYNYTHKAQYEPRWGDGTIDYCRGLIVENSSDGYVISRPFKKFHNLNTQSIPETMEENLPVGRPWVTKKYDGSLGILYSFDGFEGIATRGSFTSPQAQWATARYNKMKASAHDPRLFSWMPGFTSLFEIIYAENRIVVQYDYEGLVLIGAVDIETGRELNPSLLCTIGSGNGFRVATEIAGNLEELKNANVENEEGYVLTYSTGLKVKIKMADYVRLHRVVTGMNPRSVWEMLKNGEDFNKFNAGYPEPFLKWLFHWRDYLWTKFKNTFNEATAIYERRPPRDSWRETDRMYRKQCALYMARENQPDLSGLFFMLLDGKDIDSAVWDAIEPAGNDKSFRVEGE